MSIGWKKGQIVQRRHVTSRGKERQKTVNNKDRRRNDKLHKETSLLESRIDKKRQRRMLGRQWDKSIGDVLRMKITEAGRLAHDRDEFRAAIKGAMSSSG